MLKLLIKRAASKTPFPGYLKNLAAQILQNDGATIHSLQNFASGA